MVSVFIVGEDSVCCELGRAMVQSTGLPASIESVSIVGGWGNFKKKVPGMAPVAANVMPVLMIADADQGPCLVQQLLSCMPPNPPLKLSVRLAAREAESWLLADHAAFSEFFGVSQAVINRQPDLLRDPKGELLQMIRQGNVRILKEEMLPKKGASSPVGLGYNLHMTNFIRNHWDATRAATRSPSLARALPRVHTLLI